MGSGGIAEEKGVDVFSDTPVAGLLLQDNKAVGVVTQDKGLDAQGRPTGIYQRGYEIGGKSVLLAEGVLGSVTEEAIPALRPGSRRSSAPSGWASRRCGR